MLSQILTQKKNEELILEEFPPNYKRYKAKFPDLESQKPLFAWKNHIYNPFKVKVTPDLIIHESEHFKQQGNDPEKWLNRYLNDTEFRLEQETAAYAEQYKFCKENLPAKWYKKFLEAFAKSLSGSLYGSIISYHQAESRIRNFNKYE